MSIASCRSCCRRLRRCTNEDGDEVKRPQGFDGTPKIPEWVRPEARREGLIPEDSGGFSADDEATEEDARATAVLTSLLREPPDHDLDADGRSASVLSDGSGDAGGFVSGRAERAARRRRKRVEREEVRRFTRRSRRRRMAWIIGLGAIGVVVLGVAVAAYSPIMALTEVRVEGTNRIDSAALQAVAEHQLGTPLPLIDHAALAESLQDFPLIETYSLERLPPGTLVVRIQERTPVGVVEDDRGFSLVDAAGVVVESAESQHEGFPLIEAPAGATKGHPFRAAGEVIRALPPELRGEVVRVSASTADDVSLELASGARVLWGSAEDSPLKVRVLAALMANASPDVVGQYDVSAPESPVTR